jgi:hypothetical protein
VAQLQKKSLRVLSHAERERERKKERKRESEER